MKYAPYGDEQLFKILCGINTTYGYVPNVCISYRAARDLPIPDFYVLCCGVRESYVTSDY